MKKLVFVALAATALIVAGASPSDAFRGHGGHGGHFGHGGHVGVGVVIGPGWYDPWWGWPYYPYYPYYPYNYPYYTPPVIVEQEPQTYIQKSPQTDESGYWYFCPGPKGYYPYVKKCPKGWLKVVPPGEPDEEE